MVERVKPTKPHSQDMWLIVPVCVCIEREYKETTKFQKSFVAHEPNLAPS